MRDLDVGLVAGSRDDAPIHSLTSLKKTKSMFADNDGAQVYWQSISAGEPLVLLMGLGCSSALWFRLVPMLSRHYRVILLDNRGSGQTRAPVALVHRIQTMASDLEAVLDAAKISSAHVVGFSMGGMIAQQFAIDCPDRVRSLTLLGTNCGRPYAKLAQQHVLNLLFARGEMTATQSLDAMRPHTYSVCTESAIVAEDTAIRLATYPTLRGFQAQLYGLMAWTSYFDLPSIAAPTLIMHGVEDALIPPSNSEILAERIANSTLHLLDNASHWLFTDQTALVSKTLRAFLKKHAFTD